MSSRGVNRERQVRDYLLERDYWVCRAAGSLGDADLVALKPGMKLLIEVKSTARGPYHGFPPHKRKALLFAGELADADCWLAWWPPRDKLHWIHSSAWPSEREPLRVIKCVIDESAGFAETVAQK